MEDPLDRLQSPEASTNRLVDRELELAAAAETVPSPSGSIWRLSHGDQSSALANAITSERELASYLARRDPASAWRADRTRARLAVLLAESGALDDAFEIADEVSSQGFATGLRRVYGDEPVRNHPTEAIAVVAIAADLNLQGEWLADRLRARIARQNGDEATAQSIDAHTLEQSQHRQRRVSALAAANTLLIVLGLAVLTAGKHWSRSTGARLPDLVTWPLADGIGVFLRADFWARLYFSGLGRLPDELAQSPLGSLLFDWSTPIASIPLLLLTYRHLLREPRGKTPDPLGLDPRRLGLWTCGAFGIVALAIDLLGTQLLAWSAWSLGATGHWSEGFDEVLIWGDGWQLFTATLDFAAWTPISEEIAFRGVLFLALRRRFGAVASALLSAAFFSSLHFYSLPGFLATLWSGTVWALVLERSRSLLPAIAAHSIYNLLYVADIVLVYR